MNSSFTCKRHNHSISDTFNNGPLAMTQLYISCSLVEVEEYVCGAQMSKSKNYLPKKCGSSVCVFVSKMSTERILNRIAKAINETFTGLNFMLQGFRIYFV